MAALKKIGVTEAVHAALAHELAREQGKLSLVELSVQFCRDLRARGNPHRAQPADKAFRDGLYEDTWRSLTFWP
ncbi:antitoxin VapB [Bradyrhizobium sp. LB8.2]